VEPKSLNPIRVVFSKVDLEVATVLHALDNAVGGSAVGLREVQGDETAVFDADVTESGEAVVARFQSALGADHSAALKEYIGTIRHGRVFHAHVGGGGITH
jgi:hypothetical protein